ncbi:hypothetical protein ACIA5G_49885 [Amycolatopsis sp. NPDC051758]|uniref:hypothetical protein n=1 Tax=Amycolatopsis sp. NPDC051758 TaxID=3363935 RepID=UPI00378FAA80
MIGGRRHDSIPTMSLVTWEFDGCLYCTSTIETGQGEDRTTYFELSEARTVPGSASMPASPAPGPTAATVIVYAPEEEKSADVFFDGAETLPFVVLQHFVEIVASRVGRHGILGLPS